MKTKSIKIKKTENGSLYMEIYSVYTRRIEDGEKFVIGNFLNKEKAEKAKKLYKEMYAKHYKSFYIMTNLVQI